MKLHEDWPRKDDKPAGKKAPVKKAPAPKSSKDKE